MCAPITLELVEVALRDVPRGRRDNMGTNFRRAASTKFGRAKNVQNFALFLTTFYFECD